jgi:hypothetical protein
VHAQTVLHNACVVALRVGGDERVVVADAGDGDRSVRLTWHADAGVFTLTHWDGRVCIASVQVAPEDAAEMLVVLARGVAEAIPGWTQEMAT